MLNFLLPDIVSLSSFYPTIDFNDIVVKKLDEVGIVSPKSCWLCFVEAFCTTGLLRPFFIYNGWSSSDELIMVIGAAQQGRDRMSFPYPLYFNKAIYANWGIPTQSMTFGYVLTD